MSEKYDLLDKQGRKIGEAVPQNTNDMGGLVLILLAFLSFTVIFLPSVAIYKVMKNGKKAHWGWYIVMTIGFIVAVLALLVNLDKWTSSDIKGYIIMTTSLLGIPALIGLSLR